MAFCCAGCMVQRADKTPFVKGYYYDKDGEKVEGYLRLKPSTYTLFYTSPGYVEYRRKEAGGSRKALNPDKTKSFVIGTDTFGIVRHFRIKGFRGIYNQDFAQIVIKGSMSLYIHWTRIYPANTNFWSPPDDYIRYIIDNGSNRGLCLYKLNFSNHKKELAALFSDVPELQERILAGELKGDNKMDFLILKRFIKLYNQEIDG